MTNKICPVCGSLWIFHSLKAVRQCGRKWGEEKLMEALAKID